MVWTNLGKQRMFEEFFCSGSVDATFRLVLCSATNTEGSWSYDTSTTTQVSAVSSLPGTDAAGDVIGGTSGLVVIRDAVGDQLNFDVSSADQLGGDGSAVRAVLQTGDNAFQYSGAFDGARYVVLVAAGAEDSGFTFSDPNEIYAWWDIGQETNISDGNTLTITSLSLQGQ
jgi:hypothetical protein